MLVGCVCVAVFQAPPRLNKTDRKKGVRKEGAHVATGRGRGFNRGPDGKFNTAVDENDDDRNPNLPTSVPLPASGDAITKNPCMAAFLAGGGRPEQPQP